MKAATVLLKSLPGSELFFGKPKTSKKLANETHDQFDQRTWKESVSHHEGKLFIQPFALKNGLESSAKWLSIPIPGEGKKTFTKRFVSGILVVDKLWLTDDTGKALTMEDVEPLSLFVPSDGVRGSGKRVFRIFPSVKSWMAYAEIHVIDQKIDKKILEEHLTCCGNFVGFGSMRAQNGGINGRFSIEELQF
jgi:hypothetical protein